eukprot:TRINITY_DN3541_c0_g1_i1.p1 TRINITY_DN3541_c0_g1~~TRINITY_DN3541_c0_g1_i1.p1  ORF type:complete len:250 (+),score=50.49 TRINITY_DN3541_c0_g1_i1:70-819(+)
MPLAVKKRRVTSFDSMEADAAKAKLAAMAQELGREIRVFTNTPTSITSDKVSATSISNNEEQDEFYEFTAEDYYRVMSTKKEDKFLKTRKIRESEEAARRSRITKAVIRVRFPDNFTLEATFHPSETIQSLIDLLMKVMARPELPFYIYTTPPKELIKDTSKDFYSAGFAPGAIVYFAYNLPKVDDCAAMNSGPFLRDNIISLTGLDVISEQLEVVQSAPEPARVEPSPDVSEPKPAVKKSVKPKWLKM